MEKKRVFIIDAILAVLVLSAGIAAKVALTFINIPPCPFLTGTGLPCPVCGGTRCVYNFAKGNFGEAFSFNPYVFMIIIYLLILLFVFNVRHLTSNKVAARVLKIMCDYRAIIVLAVLCPVFWVIRVLYII